LVSKTDNKNFYWQLLL